MQGMSDFPRWRYYLVAVVLVIGTLFALPNLYLAKPAVQVSASQTAPIDQALQQKIVAALQTAKIPFLDQSIKHDKSRGDYVLIGFANGDQQKSAADTLRPLLGDTYTVAYNLQSTVP